jgi:histone acetyltransferase (RNA polymerase elongator complex component)
MGNQNKQHTKIENQHKHSTKIRNQNKQLRTTTRRDYKEEKNLSEIRKYVKTT